MFHILLALADSEKHGYRIMQTVKANSHGQFEIGPGTLYGTIKRMLADGLIVESDERPDPDLDDQRRRYYSLTERGRQVLHADLVRMEGLVRQAKSLRIIPPATAEVIQCA